MRRVTGPFESGCALPLERAAAVPAQRRDMPAVHDLWRLEGYDRTADGPPQWLGRLEAVERAPDGRDAVRVTVDEVAAGRLVRETGSSAPLAGDAFSPFANLVDGKLVEHWELTIAPHGRDARLTAVPHRVLFHRGKRSLEPVDARFEAVVGLDALARGRPIVLVRP